MTDGRDKKNNVLIHKSRLVFWCLCFCCEIKDHAILLSIGGRGSRFFFYISPSSVSFSVTAATFMSSLTTPMHLLFSPVDLRGRINFGAEQTPLSSGADLGKDIFNIAFLDHWRFILVCFCFLGFSLISREIVPHGWGWNKIKTWHDFPGGSLPCKRQLQDLGLI